MDYTRGAARSGGAAGPPYPMARIPPERKMMLLWRFTRQSGRGTVWWEEVPLVVGASRPAGNDAPTRALIRAVRLLHTSDLVPYLVAMSFLEEQAANDEGHGGDDHRIVQPG